MDSALWKTLSYFPAMIALANDTTGVQRSLSFENTNVAQDNLILASVSENSNKSWELKFKKIQRRYAKVGVLNRENVCNPLLFQHEYEGRGEQEQIDSSL
jgi:hypothetical protein